MKRLAAMFAIPLLAACATAAAERPAITHPPDGYKLGDAKDNTCRAEGPCFTMTASGRIPRGMHPFFAVEPVVVSPRAWIQPRIHAAGDDGAVTGTIQFGERENGAGQTFTVHLLACKDADALTGGQVILRVPKGCVASSPVTVRRLR